MTKELVAALGALPARKSPGKDGVPPEFHREDLKGLVLGAVKEVWESGSMGEYHNSGLICLCPKGGDLKLVSQWLPISLLPTFYKIIAKAVALRLQPHMDSWLEEEQRGFAKGRSIADNLVLFREAKWTAFLEQRDMTFLQLDFSKAFDRLEWHFMQVGLAVLGFGPNLCRWAHVLSQDANSEIIVNGERTESFRLFRSVRQGCPLAPYLFVLLIDLFLQLIKSASDIEGLQLPGGRTLRILSFADDHQVLSRTTQKSLDACAAVFEEYEVVSGLEISWEKSFATCSGSPPTQPPGLLSKVHILQLGELKKYLGVSYGPCAEDLSIGGQLLDKLAKKCAQLQSPFHSLVARVVIVNSVLMGQLWFYLAIWVPTPAEYAAMIKIIRGFLWGRTVEGGPRQAQVAWEKVVLPKDSGGLGVIDPLLKSQVMHGQWVHPAPGSEPWKTGSRRG